MECEAVSIPGAVSTHDIWKLGTETAASRLRVLVNESSALAQLIQAFVVGSSALLPPGPAHKPNVPRSASCFFI